MPKPVSPRRCPLALREARFQADREMDAELRDLLSWMCRRTRALTPDADPLVRAAQSVGLQAYAKAETSAPSLAVLNRLLAELTRLLKTLKIPIPLADTVVRRMPRAQSRSSSPLGDIFPLQPGVRVSHRDTEDDQGDGPLVEDAVGGGDGD